MLVMDEDPEPSWPVVAILIAGLIGLAAGPAGALVLGALTAAILSRHRDRDGQN